MYVEYEVARSLFSFQSTLQYFGSLQAMDSLCGPFY